MNGGKSDRFEGAERGVYAASTFLESREAKRRERRAPDLSWGCDEALTSARFTLELGPVHGKNSPSWQISRVQHLEETAPPHSGQIGTSGQAEIAPRSFGSCPNRR